MYLLDANVFMEASRFYYSFDIAPGFWKWLADPVRVGKIASIKAIRDEITAGSGDLVTWAHSLPPSFWVSETPAVASEMKRLAAWVTGPSHYTTYAISEFLASPDLKLVAFSKVVGATLVTREKSEPNSKRRVKIPDACKVVGVTCVDPFTMYRNLGLRLTE